MCNVYIPIWFNSYECEEGTRRLPWQRLHSNMVQFLLHILNAVSQATYSLHSNMVQFLLMKDNCFIIQDNLFTFQYGSIPTYCAVVGVSALGVFTFQYGSIPTFIEAFSYVDYILFTFQYGSIPTFVLQ